MTPKFYSHTSAKVPSTRHDPNFINPETSEQLDLQGLSDFLSARQSGFLKLITAADAQNNMSGSAHDQPILLPAGDDIMYAGQALCLVLASSQVEAESLADFIMRACIGYTASDKALGPIYSIKDAMHRHSIFPDLPNSASYMAHIWKVTRPNTDLSWMIAPQGETYPPNPEQKRWSTPELFNLETPLATSSYEDQGTEYTVVKSTQACGSQLHFYMETQATISSPVDGDRLQLLSSSQSPKTVQDTVASTLNIDHNQVAVKVPQMGGGYGGKTNMSRFPAAMAAMATKATNKPVHLALTREADSASVGRRHPYLGQYQLAVDTGNTNADNKGKIMGLNGILYGDGGAY